MKAIGTGKDADFSEDGLVACYNSDLANSVGNLLNRTLNMSDRYSKSTLVNRDVDDLNLQKWSKTGANDLVTNCPKKMNRYEIDSALGIIIGYATFCNVAVEAFAPWKLAKESSKKPVLDGVLYHLAESLRIIAILASPVLPKAAHGIFDQLNWKMELSEKEERFALKDVEWGGLPDGHVVGKPVPLFPRIEL
jgi:methionyl-tRNA synthetase